MASADLPRTLDLLRAETDALSAEIGALTPAQWQSASSCQGWEVGDLVSHVVRNGWSRLRYVTHSLAGDPTPVFGPSVLPIQEAIKAGGAVAAADRQAAECDEFVNLGRELSATQLATVTS